jgi:hypothetical protein
MLGDNGRGHILRMIQLKTGEFKLDGYNLIIHPDLTASDFLAGDIPLLHRYPDDAPYDWVLCWFKGAIDEMEADFAIRFSAGKLTWLSWRPMSGPEGKSLESVSSKQEEDYLYNWLAKKLGQLPPYEYEWGALGTDRDIKDGNLSVFAFFKPGLQAEGHEDFKTMFQSLRRKNET